MDKILELKNISKNIKGKPILEDISFSIDCGQVYGFLGPNGAGKTMTLRMIVGLIRPTTGEIHIIGKNIQGDFRAAIERVGCIIETPQFHEYMTGFENLWQLASMERGIQEFEMMDAVKKVGMQARIHDLVSTYSLGMKQRLGIAQAMMKKPDLLILDEPTNGLDPAGIREFRELVRFLARDTGLTLLISSHLLSEIQMMCDEVAIILHGRIIRTLKVDDLRRQQKVTWSVDHPDLAMNVLAEQFPEVPITRVDQELSAMIDSDLLPQINEQLVHAEAGLLEVCRHQKTLEDLFMELTGGETIG